MQVMAIGQTVVVSGPLLSTLIVLCFRPIFNITVHELGPFAVADTKKTHSARNTNHRMGEKHKDMAGSC